MYANEILKSTLKIFGESWKQNWVTYCNLKISWIIESFCSTPKSVHLKSRKFSKLACTSVMHFSQILVRYHGLRNMLSYVKVQSS